MTFQKSESTTSVRQRHLTAPQQRWILGTICIISFTSQLLTSAVPISIKKGEALGDGNNSLKYTTVHPPPPSNSGCRYRAESYLTGDQVPTEEPCLRCQCKKQAVVCKLRICTELMPDSPPPGCVVVQKAKSCCPKLVCPETKKITREREQRLSTGNHKNETILTGISSLHQQGFCAHEGTIYAEGSAMRSNAPCENCFCIRGEMKCSKPQCVIPLNGCKPRYRSFACCPTNYDCSESNSSAIIQSASAIPQFLKGCRVLGRFIYEGEPILPIHLEPTAQDHLCQSCFCLGGLVRCRPLECSRPIPGCEPVTEDGHCCPSRYSCQNKINTTLGITEELEKVEDNLLLLSESHQGILEPIDANGTTTTPESLEFPHSPNGSENDGDGMNVTTVDTSPDFLSNKLKSDIGSREERRNRDKDEIGNSKTSYEDDERDYNFGVPSMESVDHELIAKMTFKDGEIGKSAAGRGTTVKSIEKESPEFGISVDSQSESQNEIMETTTRPFLQEQPGPGFSFVKIVQVPLPLSPSTLENGNMTTMVEIQRNSTTQTSNGERIHQFSKSNISSSSTLTTPRSDILTLSLVPVLSPPASPATVTNLEFIPFGVEDARLLPPLSNNGTGESAPFPAYLPIKVTYDREGVKSSLIPPKGYASAPEVTSGLPENSAGVAIPPVKPSPEIVDKFRNVIMDVPVSTSLYNNGFYRHGIITTPTANSSSSFPGQVFDDSGEHLLPILNEGKESGFQVPARESGDGSKIQNPSRTYSKFGILDSPSYRHETEEKIPKLKDAEVVVPSAVPPSLSGDQQHESTGDYDDDDPSNPIYEDEDEGTLESYEKGRNEFPIPISTNNETQKPIIITTYNPKKKENNHTVTTDRTPSPGLPPPPPRILNPVVAFPFRISQKPRLETGPGMGSLGLKLSGCNIYGKMYKIGNVIRELSGPCVQCQCTEIGVECSEIRC